LPATLRVAVAVAAEGCSRIPPPLPLKPSESKGSGGFLSFVQLRDGLHAVAAAAPAAVTQLFPYPRAPEDTIALPMKLSDSC
jgi:hypothetical protein